MTRDEAVVNVGITHETPGTSKWNKVEHRLFSFIGMNWRGRPLLSYETVVNLIGGTATKSGLRVRAMLDTREYEAGQRITDEEMRTLRLKRHKFHETGTTPCSPGARHDFGERLIVNFIF